MKRSTGDRCDYWGGALMAFIGLVTGLEGLSYGIGTTTRIGPGFFPLALGAILIVVGLLIAGSSYLSALEDKGRFLPDEPQWRAWGCIILSPLLFIAIGKYAGLLPATFATVFAAAIGDRETTLKQAAGLALLISVLGIAIFSLFLKIPFPIVGRV